MKQSLEFRSSSINGDIFFLPLSIATWCHTTTLGQNPTLSLINKFDSRNKLIKVCPTLYETRFICAAKRQAYSCSQSYPSGEATCEARFFTMLKCCAISVARTISITSPRTLRQSSTVRFTRKLVESWGERMYVHQ